VGVTVAATLAACGRSGAAPSPRRSTSSSSASRYVGDLRIVALAAATENLAVTAYTRVQAQMTSGGYGRVPPAVTAFVATAHAQHRDHARAWNALLSEAGAPPVTGTPLSGVPALLRPLTQAGTVHDLTTAASALETSLAATCLAAVGSVADAGILGLAAGIAPVEAQHAAVLNFFLATAPAPQSILQTGSAFSPDVLTI
jgi:hypothetical protein